MKIAIITLFPEMFSTVLNTSILLKAQKENHLTVDLINLRDFGIGPRRQVDDTPYGGGAGMVLKPEPIFAAVEKCKKVLPTAKVVLTTPRGQRFNQIIAKKLSKLDQLIIICGHYEGFDERIMKLIDIEISIGDYILTGGEIPAMVIIDAVTRLIPGVLGDLASPQDESFSIGLLEYPHYTRPQEFRGMRVPRELLSGNHAEIKAWRRSQAVKKTKENRPDLLEF